MACSIVTILSAASSKVIILSRTMFFAMLYAESKSFVKTNPTISAGAMISWSSGIKTLSSFAATPMRFFPLMSFAVMKSTTSGYFYFSYCKVKLNLNLPFGIPAKIG